MNNTVLAGEVRLVSPPYKDGFGFARAKAVMAITGAELGAKVMLQLRLSVSMYSIPGKKLLACGEGDRLLVSGMLTAEIAYSANNTRVPVIQFDVDRLAVL